jgi:hypothetical protein
LVAATETDSSGYWHITVAIGADQFGTITAGIDDPAANHPQVTLNEPPAPTITNFQAIAQPYGVWEFKGTVTGTPDPAGMTITFGGMPDLAGKTAAVAADGTFDVYFQLDNESGTAAAITRDWWYQSSSAVFAAVG